MKRRENEGKEKEGEGRKGEGRTGEGRTGEGREGGKEGKRESILVSHFFEIIPKIVIFILEWFSNFPRESFLCVCLRLFNSSCRQNSK